MVIKCRFTRQRVVGLSINNFWVRLRPRAASCVQGEPQPIIQRLNNELVAILKDPVMSEQLSKQMFDLMPTTPEEFAGFIRSESREWA